MTLHAATCDLMQPPETEKVTKWQHNGQLGDLRQNPAVARTPDHSNWEREALLVAVNGFEADRYFGHMRTPKVISTTTPTMAR